MHGRLKIVVRNAKLNKKYYTSKKFDPEKSRLKKDDILNLKHYCAPEAVYVSHSTNVASHCVQVVPKVDEKAIEMRQKA